LLSHSDLINAFPDLKHHLTLQEKDQLKFEVEAMFNVEGLF